MSESSGSSFNSGRIRAFFKSIYYKLQREDDCLPRLDEIVDITKARNERYIGIREIPVENVIGSEGRYEDFNRDFLPKKQELQPRWSAIHKVMQEGGPLPPISVFKIDDFYFVRDGNHRVSVAKQRGQLFIEAEVTEYDIDVPLTRDLGVKERFKIQEHVYFLDTTGLKDLGRGCDIKLSRPRSYRLLLNIIQHFKAPLEESLGREMTLKEVSKEWYYRIFLPFAEGAYLDDLLAQFPRRTTGDLYVWLQMNWEEVKDSLGERMAFLAKPAELLDEPGTLTEYVPGGIRRWSNAYLRADIGLVVTCVVFNVNRLGEMNMIIVKRKYHPFEDYWSLPIAMVGENETRSDAARRCLRNSLSIKKQVKFVPFKTFDNVDRTPFGRMIAFGMMGIHYSDSYHLEAGELASEIKFVELNDTTSLVYDHNEILDDAFKYVCAIGNNFTFINELFPEEMPLRYIKQFLSIASEIVTLRDGTRT